MLIIFILSLIPVVIWVFIEPLGLRFSDINTFTTSIGQILGLLGMTLFSINIILSSKLKILDKYFKGLDKVYQNHGKIGAIAFSMLLFHPILLVVKYLVVSTNQAALFFVPFIDMPVTWGIISLVMMIILISLTFYVKLKYHIWQMSHKFMTAAFFFAILHTFLISSDISRNIFLRYYLLLFVILALLSVILKFIFDFIINIKFKYKVINIKKLNKDIIEIEMEPVNKKINFKSGQFAFFSFISKDVNSESHPFSISSGENEKNLKITVKNFGDYTSSLDRLKTDDIVFVDGPYGNFSYRNIKNNNQIWIAGGIGVTPFFSMAKSLIDTYNIDMFYIVKESNEAVYNEEFKEISNKNLNFKFNLWDTKVNGYINSGLISNLSKNLQDKDIFICGPSVLMESLKNQFVSLGVDVKKIHYENFNF